MVGGGGATFSRALAQCTLSRKREELSWKRGGERFWNRVMMKWFCWLPAQAPESSGSLSPPELISPFLLCWNCNLVWNQNQGGSGRGISRAYVQQSGAVSCWHFICLSGVDGEEFLSSFFFVLLLSAIYYFVTNWDRIGITFGFLCDLHLGSKFKKYNV